MLTFRKFLLTEQVNKPFVFAFGRYNPPTKGHIKHMEAVKDYANRVHGDYVVYTSQTINSN